MTDRIGAVLIPPQEALFRRVCSVEDDEPLEVIFRGWSKFVVLTADRAFLFPRHTRNVAPLEREVRVLEALAPHDLGFMPRVLGRWDVPGVYPHAFVAINRLPGVSYESVQSRLSVDEVSAFMRSLGATISQWQSIDTAVLPSFFGEIEAPFDGMLGRLTSPDTLAAALAHAEAILRSHVAPGALVRWEERLRPFTTLPRVLVHGDVCGNQFMVDEDLDVSGVLDWGGAHIGTPLRDFLFGEWSLEMYDRWEPDFGTLRQELWEPYNEGRSYGDFRALHVLFTIAEACGLVEASREQLSPWQSKRLGRALANLREAL